MTDIKKTAEELADIYSQAPLSRQDKDSVIRFKGDNLKITQEIQRLAFLAGFKARDEEVKQLRELLVIIEKYFHKIKDHSVSKGHKSTVGWSRQMIHLIDEHKELQKIKGDGDGKG